MTFAEFIFVLTVATTILGALTAVLSGSIVYALVGLVITMFGIAGLYIYLNAQFLAMMQILIYVGAITILIAFAIMLIGPFYKKPKEWTTVKKFVAAFITSAFSFFIFYKLIMQRFQGEENGGPFTMSTEEIGRTLFDTLTFPFELISLLIVVSIIGAIMLAIFSKKEK